jgi:hypothetical protein
MAEFSGDENDALYQQWKSTGTLPGLTDRVANEQLPPQVRGTFSTFRLEHRYDFLGPFSGIDDEVLRVL